MRRPLLPLVFMAILGGCGSSASTRPPDGAVLADAAPTDGALFDDTMSPTAHPAALAGTGDGRLFAFVPNLNVSTDAGPKAQPTLALVDTTQSGSAPTPSPIALDATKVGGGAAYAFSFWGGDFWFYSASSTSAPSTVTRWRYSTNKTYAQVVTDTGMTIIGAGASSCAPLNAPN